MKIRTKLLITFLTITVVPIFLIYISILGLSSYQNRVFRETYDVGQVDLSAGASIRVFSHLTESIQKEIEEKIAKDPEIFTDQSYLGDLNARMTEKHSFLMVTKDGKLIYIGNDETASSLEREISDYAEINDSDSWGNYLDKNTEHLIKQREFELADGSRIAVYLVTNVVDVIPEVKSMRDVLQQCADPFYHWRYADSLGLPVDLMADRKASGGNETDPRRKSGLHSRCGGR